MSWKSHILQALGAAVCALTALSASAQDLSRYEAEAEGVLQRLRGEMMREMRTAMEIGPADAISVCRHLAPEIEAAIEAETGWEIRRIGLKVRNPENAPTAAERGILLGYEGRKAAGQSIETLRTTRLTGEGAEQTVHFMQAVPTFEVCIVCHGSSIPSDVAEEVARLYPDDAAVGYSIGDIRGAFSLYKIYDARTEDAAATSEWDRIAALPLPSEMVLPGTGATVDPRQGRDLFRSSCKSCHSAVDLARHAPASGAAGTCRFLKTHGRTDDQEDCNIAGFLEAVGAALPFE